MERRIRITAVFLLALMLSGCSSKADKYYNEGMKNLDSGMYENAVECFQQGLENNQRLAENYRGLGIAY